MCKGKEMSAKDWSELNCGEGGPLPSKNLDMYTVWSKRYDKERGHVKVTAFAYLYSGGGRSPAEVETLLDEVYPVKDVTATVGEIK